MKLIIAGSRNIAHLSPHWFRDTLKYFGINSTLDDEVHIDEVVSGTANGIDKLGEAFARKYLIPIKRFPADWDKHGRAAGPIRNKLMAEYGDVLLLIWNGYSKGSASMKTEMLKLHKPVYEIILTNEEPFGDEYYIKS